MSCSPQLVVRASPIARGSVAGARVDGEGDASAHMVGRAVWAHGLGYSETSPSSRLSLRRSAQSAVIEPLPFF